MEGGTVWPLMEPGKLIRGGVEISGESPSGKKRGDKFFIAGDKRLNGKNACPTLQSLHGALNRVGDALSDALLAEPRLGLRLGGRTDTLFACFPGGGAEYGAHFDGGAGEPRKLTAILYVNEGWAPESGGQLQMYDATSADGEP